MKLTVFRSLAAAAPLLLPLSAGAQFNLGNYQLTSTFNLVLPAGQDEASGVTFNADNGRLYVVEDEGERLYELSTDGTVLGSMTLSGFEDVEGITYIGDGEFLLAEERIQDVFRFTYTGGGSLTRSALPVFSFGDTVGNVGLEGISFDPVNNVVLGVKEKTPQAIYAALIAFPTMTGSLTSFVPSLGLLDLSDVQALSTFSSLIGTGDQENLLIISQESQKLLEISRTGTILSEFDFSGLSLSAEGVTIDQSGNIYFVSEDPKLFVLTAAIPEPSTYAAVACAIGAFLFVRRRRQLC